KIQGGIWNMNGVLYPYNNTAMCLGHAQEIEEKVSEIYTIIKNINNSYYVGINTSLFDEYEQENILENTKEISEIESIIEN
ncbi:hypothetical protein DD924_17025, partial [Staphylococcus pseudintermedius]